MGRKRGTKTKSQGVFLGGYQACYLTPAGFVEEFNRILSNQNH